MLNRVDHVSTGVAHEVIYRGHILDRGTVLVGGVVLLVEVYQQGLLADLPEALGEAKGSGGLASPSLAIENGHNGGLLGRGHLASSFLRFRCTGILSLQKVASMLVAGFREYAII